MGIASPYDPAPDAQGAPNTGCWGRSHPSGISFGVRNQRKRISSSIGTFPGFLESIYGKIKPKALSSPRGTTDPGAGTVAWPPRASATPNIRRG